MTGRKKVNPDYDPIKARNELAKIVAELYLHPSVDMTRDKAGRASMKSLEEYFGLTMTKIRKLLVTADVYTFIKDGRDMVKEVQQLKQDGLSSKEIAEKLGVSTGTVNSFLPYESGTYNADFTADGYDYRNVSTEARRKRNQRKREKMKDKDKVEKKEEEVSQMKDQRTYMDRYKDKEKQKKLESAEKDWKWARSHGFTEKMSAEDILAKVRADVENGKLSIMDLPYIQEKSPEEIQEMKKREGTELIRYIMDVQKKYLEMRDENKKAKVKTVGYAVPSERYVHGKPIGDYIYKPDPQDYYFRENSNEVFQAEKYTMYGAIDEYRIPHMFILKSELNPLGIIYDAEEVYRCRKSGKKYVDTPDTHFYFRTISPAGDKRYASYDILEKIVVGLQNLTLKRERIDFYSSNTYMKGRYTYTPKQVGSITLNCKDDGTMTFGIDGKEYDAHDFALLFGLYDSWVFNYQMGNDTDPILESDMTLLPTRIDADTMSDELNDILFALTQNHDGKFLARNNVPAFDVLFEKLLKKLDFYYHSNPLKMGEDAAENLVRILKNVGTDDDMFPVYEINMVEDVVNTFLMRKYE